MSCERFEQQWEDWLRGEGSAELREHLEHCAACRAQAAEFARTPGLLALLRQEPAVPGPAFWACLGVRLEAEDRAGDFWAALNWVAVRAALALAVLVLLLTLGVLLEPPAAVADFDTPPTYFEGTSGGGGGVNGQLNRDQVVLTLVAYQEPQR